MSHPALAAIAAAARNMAPPRGTPPPLAELPQAVVTVDPDDAPAPDEPGTTLPTPAAESRPLTPAPAPARDGQRISAVLPLGAVVLDARTVDNTAGAALVIHHAGDTSGTANVTAIVILSASDNGTDLLTIVPDRLEHTAAGARIAGTAAVVLPLRRCTFRVPVGAAVSYLVLSGGIPL